MFSACDFGEVTTVIEYYSAKYSITRRSVEKVFFLLYSVVHSR